MKIESVENVLAGRWHFVRITTDSGIVGVGESGIWGYPEASERIVDVWRRGIERPVENRSRALERDIGSRARLSPHVAHRIDRLV